MNLGLLYGVLGLAVVAADLVVAVAALVVALRWDPDPRNRGAAWLLCAATAGCFVLALLSRLALLVHQPLRDALGATAASALTSGLELLGLLTFAAIGVALLRFAPPPPPPAPGGGA